MNFCNFEFAPLSIPLHRRLETLAVFHYVLSFLLMPFFCILLPLYIIFMTPFWWLSIFYVLWYIYDAKTPRRGSRRRNWFRYSPLWTYFRDYFPIKLIKTVDLDPNRNYIMGYHPHGVLCVGMFGNFATEATGFSELFPGITPYPCTLGGQFQFPLRREYIMLCGCIDVSKEAIEFVINQPQKGNAVVVAVGGAMEVLYCRSGAFNLILNKRKGFVKIALRNGADLVPIISFGENDLYRQFNYKPNSWFCRFQDKVKQILGFPLPVVHGRGIFNYNFGFLPYRKPIWTVVGRPIRVDRVENPSKEEIDRLHSLYIEELRKLFQENKAKYGVPDETDLHIVK
uniref:Acyltransferase n=1 Tax=Romanomermis culicivorax TaxID=13658 RepID=A0A915JRR5_ROMCU